MKDIFSDLYNKVLSFFVTPQSEEQTKEKAINRLKVVLMQDRVGFSERALQMMKGELVECVSKYMEIDEDLFELQLEAQDEKTMLILTIPVIRPKTDEEIDRAIEEQKEKSQVKAEEIVQELEGIIEERAQALADELLAEVEDEEDTKAENIDDSEDTEDTEDTGESESEEDTPDNKTQTTKTEAAKGKSK